jgi:hypothetical protein
VSNARPAAKVDSAAPAPPTLGKAQEQLDALLRNLERVAMRLPAEPVGVGAVWRERRTLPEGGIQAVSETTYTLSSIDGATIQYTATGTATGPKQTIEHSGMKVDVTDTHGRSEAKGTIDLSRYAAEATTSSVFSTTLAVHAAEGGAAGSADKPSTVEIAMSLQIGKPAPGAPEAPPTRRRRPRVAAAALAPRQGQARGPTIRARTARRSACTCRRRSHRTCGASRRRDRTCSRSPAHTPRTIARSRPRSGARTACTCDRQDRTCTRPLARTLRRNESTRPHPPRGT